MQTLREITLKDTIDFQVLIDALEDIQPKFADVKNLESELTDILGRKDLGLVAVKESVDELEEANKKNSTDLRSAKVKLQEQLAKTANFHEKTDEYDEWLEAANGELETTDKPAEDPDDLKAQLSKLEELQDEAINKRSLVDDVSRVGKALVAHCINENKVKTVVLGKVEEIEDSYASAVSRINARHARVHKLLLKRQDFDTTFAELIEALDVIEERFAKVKPLNAKFEELKLVKQEYEVSVEFIRL